MALIRIPGPKRQFLDADTGAVVGRREADRVLGRQTFSSNEAKARAAKLAEPELAAARPARGRYKPITVPKGLLSPSELSKISGLRPPRYSTARYITMPIELYYGSTPDMLLQATMDGYVSEFDRIQTAIEKNPTASSIYVEMFGVSPDGEKQRVVVPGLRHAKGMHYQLVELLDAAHQENHSSKSPQNTPPGTVFTSIRFVLGFNNTPEQRPKKKKLKVKSPDKNKSKKRLTYQERQVKIKVQTEKDRKLAAERAKRYRASRKPKKPKKTKGKHK